MTIKKLRKLVAAYWRPSTFYVLLIAVFGVLLWFRLGTLTGGYSAEELATWQASTSFRHILENPINAPFLLLGRALLFLGEHSLMLMRLTAVAFGLLTLTSFFWLVRYWHGERSAVLGTIIFGCGPWFLHTSRLGTPDVLLFVPFAVIACSIWLQRTDNRFALFVGFFLAASLLYIPGALWLLVVGAIWRYKTILRLFKHHLPMMLTGLAGMLALLAPLAGAIYSSPQLAKVMLGLPATGWPQPLESLERLVNIPLNLFLRGPQDPEHWLARLPVLAAFSAAMLLFGAYLYIKHWRMLRAKLLGAMLLVGAVLISLGGAVSLTIIIPIVYLLVAAGVGLMLDYWFSTFPRNTIAQGIGLGLITLAVTATCWYNLRRYFIAWPATPATQQVFVIKQAP